MPVLNRDLYEELCDLNKDYLNSQNLIIDSHGSDIEMGEDQNQIITKLIKQEKDNFEACDEKYQKEKNKAKYITLLLSVAVVLLGAGFALAPLFIVSTIVIPVLPVLLIGFAIVGITKLFLNLQVNRFKFNATHASSTLEQLKDVALNAGQEIISNFNHTIQEIKNTTMTVSKKIDVLAENNTYGLSQLMTKLGTFPISTTPSIPIPLDDSANGFHDQERASSPTHR